MDNYRFADPDSMAPLARLLDSISAEMLSIRSALPAAVAHCSTPLTKFAESSRRSAELIRLKASLVATDCRWRPVTSTVGFPTWDAPNGLRSLIESNRAVVRAELLRVVEQMNRLSSIGVRSGQHYEGLRRDYETLVTLSTMELIHFRIASSTPIGGRAGSAGYRAGIWIGPHDADHVLVMIPGMNTTSESWLADNVPDAAGLQILAADLADDHRRGTVAVVPLLAYQPPQSVLDAPLGRFWRDGAVETAEALAPLNLDGRHVVGWGHSYGAAVLGAASALSGRFDDLVMVGAAGTGTESLEELGVDGNHLFVATHWNDPIRLVPNDYHGVSPEVLPHIDVPTSPSTGFDAWKALLSFPWFVVDGLPDHDYLDDEIAVRAFAAIAIGLRDLSDL